MDYDLKKKITKSVSATVVLSDAAFPPPPPDTHFAIGRMSQDSSPDQTEHTSMPGTDGDRPIGGS